MKRILIILPCCIGDVIIATAVLGALRRAYPQAHIAWAVGSWSRAAIADHPWLSETVDTGPDALPVRSWGGFWRFVRLLRRGHYDLIVSLVRSPLMSAAVWLGRAPLRAGLDSGGRGFGYNVRAPIDPRQPRHEGDIYLDVIRALGLDTRDCWAYIPSDPSLAPPLLSAKGLRRPYIVLSPVGGRNPGMLMDSKRWPAHYFAQLGDQLAEAWGVDLVLLGGAGDEALVADVQNRLRATSAAFVGELSWPQIGALATAARMYIGNDTGLTHYAAACGAKTVMILGPSDPIRYAPFVPSALALWKPAAVSPEGVAGGAPQGWDWTRDGINPTEAYHQIMAWDGAQ